MQLYHAKGKKEQERKNERIMKQRMEEGRCRRKCKTATINERMLYKSQHITVKM
jgi:hypothetical protein